MMPSVLRRSGLDFIRNGSTVSPRAIVSTCEVCGDPAAFGDNSTGAYLTWCREHLPSQFMRERKVNAE
jgi:hypothetical protein